MKAEDGGGGHRSAARGNRVAREVVGCKASCFSRLSSLRIHRSDLIGWTPSRGV